MCDRNFTKKELRQYVEKRSQEVLGVNSPEEAFSMLDSGKIDGTVAEIEFSNLRSLLESQDKEEKSVIDLNKIFTPGLLARIAECISKHDHEWIEPLLKILTKHSDPVVREGALNGLESVYDRMYDVGMTLEEYVISDSLKK